MRRVVATDLPVDLGLTLGPLRYGGRWDPCVRTDRTVVWRASRFASGPATARYRSVAPRRVEVDAWGPGAAQALDDAPDLLGAGDDDGGLPATPHPGVGDLARRFPGLRMSRSGNALEALVPTILGQKVQGQSAKASFCAMVRAAGEPSPPSAEAGAPRLLLPPSAAWLAAQPSWAWHRWGVEGKRATTIRVAASYAHRLAESPALARRRLLALPGVGVWSAAEVAQVAFGDPDAVSVGDFWLKHWVCHTLAGEARGTDARMVELLRPWAGQRGRVCRLIMLGGRRPPRYGPRLELVSITDL